MKLVDISGTKKKEYLKAKIDELETNSKIKNIRDLNTGISDLNPLSANVENKVSSE